MNQSVKRFIVTTIRKPLVWRCVQQTLGRASGLYRKLATLREREFTPEEDAQADIIIRPGEVLHGPFKGMRLPPGFKRHYVNLGSYEAELHPIVEEICATNYDVMVNIGCGLGYYAVGLAMRMPQTFTYAYDGNPEELGMAKQIAELNGVSSRIKFGGFCTPEAMTSLDLKDRALIIADCEGYERELFTKDTINKIARHDVLIETHDMANIEITRILQDRFRDTHAIVEIDSVDDILKAYRYDYPELRDFSLTLRRKVLGEGRGKIMRWLFAKSNLSPQVCTP